VTDLESCFDLISQISLSILTDKVRASSLPLLVSLFLLQCKDLTGGVKYEGVFFRNGGSLGRNIRAA